MIHPRTIERAAAALEPRHLAVLDRLNTEPLSASTISASADSRQTAGILQTLSARNLVDRIDPSPGYPCPRWTIAERGEMVRDLMHKETP